MSGADILFEHKLAAFRVDSFGEEFHEFSQAQNKNKKICEILLIMIKFGTSFDSL